MDPELRTLTPDDWMLFRDTRLRALADSPDAFGVTLDEARDQPESLWRSRVGSPGPTLVVLDEARPVAMGGVFAPPDEKHAYIWGMWTAPEARGRGHAVRILDALVEWCDEHDLDVLLHVTEGNDTARRIYVTGRRVSAGCCATGLSSTARSSGSHGSGTPGPSSTGRRPTSSPGTCWPRATAPTSASARRRASST